MDEKPSKYQSWTVDLLEARLHLKQDELRQFNNILKNPAISDNFRASVENLVNSISEQISEIEEVLKAKTVDYEDGTWV